MELRCFSRSYALPCLGLPLALPLARMDAYLARVTVI